MYDYLGLKFKMRVVQVICHSKNIDEKQLFLS